MPSDVAKSKYREGNWRFELLHGEKRVGKRRRNDMQPKRRLGPTRRRIRCWANGMAVAARTLRGMSPRFRQGVQDDNAAESWSSATATRGQEGEPPGEAAGATTRGETWRARRAKGGPSLVPALLDRERLASSALFC